MVSFGSIYSLLSWRMKDKLKRLTQVAKEIAECSVCRQGKSGLAVPGEAPGKTESLTGRPFVGRSGQLLRKNILYHLPALSCP